MKRSRSSSSQPSASCSVHVPQSLHQSHDIIPPTMACPHFEAALSSLAPPKPHQQVHKEECTLCFDDFDSPNGIDVCLCCFNGGCTGNGDREHAKLHFEKTAHALVVNIKRTLKPKSTNQDQDASPPKKLAIAAESDKLKFDYHTTPKCLLCPQVRLPDSDKLNQVIDGVLKSMSSAQQSEVKAWEEEILPCSHTVDLAQPGDPIRLELNGLAKCSHCDLNSNLWLCLTCGNLGCGRAQFGGIGGNGHGLTHFEQTGHPISVKQGTITPQGTADIFCYACQDARIDPHLAKHLSHFGINVLDLSKTEKSMTELQIEQNLKFDFNMTGEDGKALEPVFGPGLTGLKNLGNSCYMASVVQSIFSFAAFRTRYLDAYRPHTLLCNNPNPASCFECQMGKLADGLLSGRYSVPRKPEGNALGGWASEAASQSKHQGCLDAKENIPFQQGICPSMFKALVGKGHQEFATMRQQDADEFFKHLVGFIQKENKKLGSTSTSASGTEEMPSYDPTNIFSFGLEQRLQCTKCKRVRYSVEAQDAGLSLPVPLRPKVEPNVESDSKQPAEGIHVPLSADKLEYEPVELTECLDLFTATEELDYHCPGCNEKVIATKRTLLTSFPQVLAIQVRRFQLVNWVPQKVNVPIIVPLEPFDLDKYLGKGKLDHEEELPDETQTLQTTNFQEPTFDVGVMSQLMSMGFPEIRCKKALLATGNSDDVETAMNWLFAHIEDVDLDDPIDFTSTTNQTQEQSTPPIDTSMLEDMGFSKNQAFKALRLHQNQPDLAVAWLFENPDDPGEDPDTNVILSDTDTDMVESSCQHHPSVIIQKGSVRLPATFQIRSFISHKGPSVHSGHYVAHIRSGSNLDQTWSFFNDEKVVYAPFTSSPNASQQDLGVQGLSQQAYLFFFERID